MALSERAKANAERFHRDNPHIYGLFKRFALEALGTGRRRFGSRSIIERIRWYTTIETKGDARKINDHTAPHYARMLIAEDPRFKGFFELRERKGPEPMKETFW